MAKQDDWTRLTVRIPPELYERIQAAVTAGPNSMNAEIVVRLEQSFQQSKNSLPREQLPAPPTDENTVYIILDTDGMPISWQEALTHLSQINKAAKSNYSSQHARIYATEHLSSEEREEEDYKLFLKYRQMNKRRREEAARITPQKEATRAKILNSKDENKD